MILSLAEFRTLTNTNASDGMDAYITTLLPVVTSEISNFCDRTFDLTRYSQWFHYDGSRLIVLPEYPVENILGVYYPARVATVTCTGYNISVTPTSIVVTSDSDFTSNTYLFSTYTNLTLLQAVIEGAYPGITIDIDSGYETMSSLLLRTGSGLELTGGVRLDTNLRLQDRSDRVVEVAYNTPFIMTYSNDYTYNDELLIIWNGGYSTMPKELQMAAALIIKDYLAISKVKSLGLIKSQTVTNYSITYADQEVISDLVKKYAGILSGYVKKTL
jgi:hypothetical protein